MDLNTITEMVTQAFNSKLEERLYIYSIIENILIDKLFDADVLLAIVVERISTIEDICLARICTNNGSDPNKYVKSTNATLHFILHGLLYIPENIRNVFILTMILSGANVDNRSYKTKTTIVPETVREYVYKHYKLTISPTTYEAINDVSSLDEKEQLFMNVAFGLSDKFTHTSFIYMCSTRITGYISEYSEKSLKMCIRCNFDKMVTRLLNEGVRPDDHCDVNYLISHFSIVKESKFGYLVLQNIKNIILEFVERGVKFTDIQMTELSSIDHSFHPTIMGAYRQPRWQKVFSVTKDRYVPDRFRVLHYLLGGKFDASKEEISKNFKVVTMGNSEDICDKFRERNSIKFMYLHTSIFEELGEPEITNDALEYSWFDYPSIFTEYINGEIVLSSKFDRVSNINIKNKISICKELGIDYNTPLSIQQILKELKSDDEEYKENNSESLGNYESILESKGYTVHNLMNTDIDILNNKIERTLLFIDEYIRVGHHKTLSSVPLSIKFKVVAFIRMLTKRIKNDSQIFDKLIRL